MCLHVFNIGTQILNEPHKQTVTLNIPYLSVVVL